MSRKRAEPAKSTSWLFYSVLAFSAGLAATGILLSDGIVESYKAILTNPAVLLTDFSYIGGIGGAFLNAGLMGILASLLMLASKDFRGISFSAIMMCIGFAFFGKTPLAGFVIILGTVLRNIVTRRKLLDDIVVSLFGNCMAPMVSFIAYATPAGWPIAILAGLAAGFILPQTALLTKRACKNLNLYNIGFASAIIMAVAAELIRGFGISLDPISGPFLEYPSWSYIAVVLAFAIVGLTALLFIGGSSAGFLSLSRINCEGADFLTTSGAGPALLNFSISGIILVLVPGLILKSPMTGPLLGTIIAVSGWMVTAKKPIAMISLMAGYCLAFFVSSYSITPGIAMGSLFVTGLCPLSDRLGPGYGLLAGFLHLFVVTKCSSIHGGLMLYNNGFSTAIVAIAILALYKTIQPGKSLEL